MAEVDDDALPASVKLVDCLPDLDNLLNRHISSARWDGITGEELVEYIFDLFGDAPNIDAPIETWIKSNLPKATPGTPGKQFQADPKKTKYRNTLKAGSNSMASIILCNRILMGGDKVGHFFQLGYRIYHRKKGNNPTHTREVIEDQSIAAWRAYKNYEFGKISDAILDGGARIIARKTGVTSPPKFVQTQWNHGKEMGSFGIRATGVYSPADIAANNAGARFYTDLAKLKGGKISLARYIDRTWNESVNCNKYAANVGTRVWENLLLHRNWVLQMDTASHDRKVHANCTFLKKANTFEAALSILGKPPEGSLTLSPVYKKDAKGLIEGITLSGPWSYKGESGLMTIKSSRECWIKGTWGTGQSNQNGGDCLLFM
ncbi:hypothetical protein [uncultured Roseibium sp.]|uniref:hypothetical protein n=1 Tax=uncultured Roseibium sp. TaxID=1936171 RepID=UPI002629749A|nr:hypothetical protein [uncultured Roseibium sp.]